jgi:hypothetical protein
MSKKDILQDAERAFVDRGLSIAELVEMFPVSETTLRRWNKKHNWEKKRQIYKSAHVEIAEKVKGLLDKKLNELNELDASAIDIDVLRELKPLVKTFIMLRNEYREDEIVVYAGEIWIPWLNENCEDKKLRGKIFELWNRMTNEVMG